MVVLGLLALASGCTGDEAETISTPEPTVAPTTSTAPADADDTRWTCHGVGRFTADELDDPSSRLTLEELGVDATELAERGLADSPATGWFEVTPAGGERVVLHPDALEEEWSVLSVLEGRLHVAGECTPVRATEPRIGIGTWDPLVSPLASETMGITVGVTERACSGGEDPTPRLLPPEVVLDDDTVTITLFIRRVEGDEVTCEGLPPTPIDVELPEPLGDRTLLDGSTLPAREVVAPAAVEEPVAAPPSLDELPMPVERPDGTLVAPWRTIPVFGADDGMFVQIRRCADQHLLEPEIDWAGDQLTLAFPVTASASNCEEPLPTDVWVTLGRSPTGAALLDGATDPPTPVAPPPELSEGVSPTPSPPPPSGASVEIVAELVVTRWPLPICAATYSPLPGLSVMSGGSAAPDRRTGLADLLAGSALPLTGWIEVTFASDPVASTYIATLDGETAAAFTFLDVDDGAALAGAQLCAGLPADWQPDGETSPFEPFLDLPFDPVATSALLDDFPVLGAAVRTVLDRDPAPLEVEVEVPRELRCDVMEGIEDLLEAEGFEVTALETAELEDPGRSLRYAGALRDSQLVTLNGSYSTPTILFVYDPQVGPDEVPFSGDPLPRFACGIEDAPR